MLNTVTFTGARATRRPHWPRAAVDPRSVSADVWAVVALVAIAAAIRIVVIANQSFWTDEALGVLEARSSFGGMLHLVRQVETTPPLFFLLEWEWARLFGTGEAAMRAISTIAGISLTPTAYLAARELVSRRAGVIAAALVTVNPLMIWYSQEARAYMLLTAFSGAAFLWFLRARREPTAVHLAWWAAFASLAVMTHFFAGFVIAPQALWLLWTTRRRGVLFAVGVVAAVQLAMAPFAFSDASHGVGWIAQTSRLTRVAHTFSEWGASQLFRQVSVGGALIGGAIMIALVVGLLVLAGDRRTRAGAIVAGGVASFAVLVPLALGFVGQDYLIPRNLIAAFIPVVAAIACACTAPRAPRLGCALAVSLLVLFSACTVYVQTHPFLQRPQWRDTAKALGAGTAPRAVIAVGGTTADPLKVYLPGARWAQSQTHAFTIEEIDVVGAFKRLKLAASPPSGGVSTPGGGVATPGGGVATPAHGRARLGVSLPRSIAPPGTRLLERRAVHRWVIARFALDRPATVTIEELHAMASVYLRRTPRALLVFTQHVRN